MFLFIAHYAKIYKAILDDRKKVIYKGNKWLFPL